MAKADLTININAKDNASTTFKNISAEMSAAGKSAEATADQITRMGGSFENVGSTLDGLIKTYKASTPEAMKYAAAIGKVEKEFEDGNITSKEAVTRLEAIRKEMGAGGAAAQSFGQQFSAAMIGINQGLELAQKLARGAQQAFDFAKEGAQIDYTKDKFDRLAISIGTTSTALMDDLRPNTRGMMSEMEMIGGATELVSLGLARTHDQAVRLTTVAAQLNMNMNQLSLTLSNQTTMRFDTLGVSIEGFDEKLKALEATGMDTNAAFTEAFLQQAEAQVRLVGEAADSSVAPFIRLEVALTNYMDSVKESTVGLGAAASAGADLVDGWTDQQRALSVLKDALDSGMITQREYVKLSGSARYATQAWYDAVEDLNGELVVFKNSLQGVYMAVAEGERDELNEIDRLHRLAAERRNGAVAMREFIDVYGTYTYAIQENTTATISADAVMGALNGTLDEQLATVREMQEKYEGMSSWQQKWGEGKDIPKQVADGLQAVNDKLSDMVVKQSVLDLLNSGLDGAAQHAYDLALQMGMIDQATFNAMTTQQNFKDFLLDTEDVDAYGVALAWMADNLDRLTDRTYTVTQIINTIEVKRAIDAQTSVNDATDWRRVQELTGQEIGGTFPGFANGGSFTVPQGYNNDSYLMGVSSGEHVQVTPAGANTSGQFTIVINNPIVTDEDSFRRMIEPAAVEIYRRQEAIRGN